MIRKSRLFVGFLLCNVSYTVVSMNADIYDEYKKFDRDKYKNLCIWFDAIQKSDSNANGVDSEELNSLELYKKRSAWFDQIPGIKQKKQDIVDCYNNRQSAVDSLLKDLTYDQTARKVKRMRTLLKIEEKSEASISKNFAKSKTQKTTVKKIRTVTF